MTAGSLVLEADVLAASQGNREAFARLIDASRSLVCSIALAIVRDFELSRDVAQEVYIAVWKDAARLRNPASFLPWLRQLTRNKAHQAVRGHVRYQRRVTPAADEDLDRATDPAADILGGMISREELDLLSKAIAELPDSSRDVVILFYQEDRSVHHVADLLGISEDAVKQRLSRARDSLRASLTDQFGALVAKIKPSSGFTAAVLAALPLSQPKTAAAASLAVAAKPTLAAASSAIAGVLGALTGALASALGVLSDYRAHVGRTENERQRWHLRLFSLVQFLIAPAMAAIVFLWPNPVGGVAAVTFVVAAYWLTRALWLPRIVRIEPEQSASAPRRLAWALVGTLFAFGGVFLAWYSSH